MKQLENISGEIAFLIDKEIQNRLYSSYKKNENTSSHFKEGCTVRGLAIYPRLMAQMYLKGFDNKRLAEETGLTYLTLRRRLRGETTLKLSEANRIRNALGTDMPLEKLFERREDMYDV